MIKITNKILKDFLKIMDENDEFVFGNNEYLKKQLESCLNTQGYWSGTAVRVYYNDQTKTFATQKRW